MWDGLAGRCHVHAVHGSIDQAVDGEASDHALLTANGGIHPWADRNLVCLFFAAAAVVLMARHDRWYCPIRDVNNTSVSENCAIVVDYGVDDPDGLEYSYEVSVT
ncbi:hypothetical protein GQ600_4470 [Phytophthora cactorum]|nr:hypothetical protein GQ600_4470 [Phytophthora cactorum]